MSPPPTSALPLDKPIPPDVAGLPGAPPAGANQCKSTPPGSEDRFASGLANTFRRRKSARSINYSERAFV
eukprot:2499232-Pyramimonas_sp.AAC.1